MKWLVSNQREEMVLEKEYREPDTPLAAQRVRFTFIGKESGTAILAVFSRAGSPCHVV